MKSHCLAGVLATVVIASTLLAQQGPTSVAVDSVRLEPVRESRRVTGDGAAIALTAAADNLQFCLPFSYLRVTTSGGGGSLSITELGIAAMGQAVALWLGTGGLVTTDAINAPSGTLFFQTVGVNRFQVLGNSFSGMAAGGASLQNETASCTNPTLITNRNSFNIGWGGIVGGGNDAICGIIDSVEEMKVASGLVDIGGVQDFGLEATAPANCDAGDVYTDTSPAKCWCSSTDTWSVVEGVSCA